MHLVLYIIGSIGLLIGLGGLVWVIGKRLPDLAMMNLESIAEEKEGRVRNRILIEKMKRRAITTKHFLQTTLRPVGERVRQWTRDSYQHVLAVEKTMLEKTQPLQQLDVNQRIGDLLTQAQGYQDEEKYDEAENVYIEIIQLDHVNIDAYAGLVDIYRNERDYRKARETCRHLLKLLSKIKRADQAPDHAHRLAGHHASLGEIYQLEHKEALALKAFQKAVETEPNNPRFLDLLLKISILLKRKDVAEEAFLGLQQADPENQKLAELQEEIDQLPEVAKESGSTTPL